MFKRILAALGVAMLATIGGATTAGAVERQPLDGPLNVQVSDDSGRIPEALRVGSPGTVSALYGAPGAWAVTHSDPYTGEPGVGGWGTFINVYRVLPYDGAGFGSSDRQNVCDGEFVGGPEQYSDQSGGSLGVPRDPYPAIDLSTVSWIAKGYSEGYLIPSNEYIDDDSWNPNLDGLVWRPATHMEEIRFADIRMDAPGEGNASFSVVVSTYYTPGWDCGDDPFVPETGDEPESTPEPPVEDEPEPTPEPTAEAVPDEGRTPKGQVIALDVLANDDRVVELVSVGDLTPADAGLVTVEDGQAVFEPSPEFVGVATFAYEGHSPEGLVRGATATVTVFESDPEPELTPEPEPEPDPEPEPTPEVPVVDEPEPVIPFAPSTGIEVDEPSSSSALGWALIGSGLSLGAATWFAARRWL